MRLGLSGCGTVVLLALVLGGGGCVPILINGHMQAEEQKKNEWRRQNFEREKEGMPQVSYQEWCKAEAQRESKRLQELEDERFLKTHGRPRESSER